MVSSSHDKTIKLISIPEYQVVHTYSGHQHYVNSVQFHPIHENIMISASEDKTIRIWDKYKKGQFYDWHCDSFEEPYNQPENVNTHGKQRKLSMTVSLTNPEEYEGGDLEFDFRNTDEGSQPRIS